MHEGSGSHSVCLFVTTLAATYLICESKLWCYKVAFGIPKAYIVWISLKMLCSPVSTSFADAKLLAFDAQCSIYTKSHATTSGSHTL